MGNVDIEAYKKQSVHTSLIFKEDKDFKDNRFMRVRIAAMHSGVNRNKSKFSKECIENAKDTFANIPILAEVSEYTDKDGNKYLDYTTHAMHIEEDYYDPDVARIIYDEKVVGIVPEKNDFEMVLDEKTGNYYAMVTALLYRDYGNYVCDILEKRGNETEVSAEINCSDMSFSVEDGVIEVGTMQMGGITLLGAQTAPGMVKAHAEVFSLDEDNKQNQILKIMQEIKESLDNYINEIKFSADLTKGGTERTMNHFNELLAKYEKVVEDITFDYENMSDEELDAAFAKAFTESEELENDPEEKEAFEEGEGTTEDETGAEDGTQENLEEADAAETGEEAGQEDAGEAEEQEEFEEQEVTESVFAIIKNGTQISTFSVSHEDIRYALYNLIAQYDELDNDWYGIESVFDDHFIMRSWCTDSIYGQKYSVDGENVALEGERWRLYAEYVTESEKAELESMRANYAAIETELAEYHRKDLLAQKKELISSKDYSSISDKKEFVEIVEEVNADKNEQTFEELKTRCDSVLLGYAKAGNLSFAAAPEQKTVKAVQMLDPNKKAKKASRYGSLKFK